MSQSRLTVKSRYGHKKRPPVDHEKIISLHNQGMKHNDIAKECDCAYATVWYVLNDISEETKAKFRGIYNYRNRNRYPTSRLMVLSEQHRKLYLQHKDQLDRIERELKRRRSLLKAKKDAQKAG